MIKTYKITYKLNLFNKSHRIFQDKTEKLTLYYNFIIKDNKKIPEIRAEVALDLLEFKKRFSKKEAINRLLELLGRNQSQIFN